MTLVNWLDRWSRVIYGTKRGPNGKSPKSSNSSGTRLSSERLEDRRVLDGVPAGIASPTSAPVEQAVLVAGPADGVSDHYRVTVTNTGEGNLLRVHQGAELVFEQHAQPGQGLQIIGSADDETLEIDLAGEAAQWFDVQFVGGGGSDSVILSDAVVDRVEATSSIGQSLVTVSRGAESFQLQFGGSVALVIDQLSASSRSLDFSMAGAHVRLAQATDGQGVSVTGELGADWLIRDSSTDFALSASGSQSSLTVDSWSSSSLEQVELRAALVRIDGDLQLHRAEFEVTASEFRQSGNLSAESITLMGREQSLIWIAGRLEGRGDTETGRGGQIDLFAERIAVVESAALDVSGLRGAGKIRIGGDWHGAAGPAPLADRVVVDSGVSLTANATLSGDAGQIVIWSRDTTYFAGRIVANASQGQAGAAEVSSSGALIYRGQTILEGAHGSRGTLLLDPRRVTIVSGSGAANDDQLNATGTSPANRILFADGGTTNFTISEAALEAATSNILIQATEAIILENLSDDLLSLTSGVSLVLQTRNSTAVAAGDPEGIVFVDSADSIRASGAGGVTLQAGVTANSTGTVSGRNGTASITVGGVQSESGAIVVEATGMVTVAGSLQTSGGQISIQGDDLDLQGMIATPGNLVLETNSGRSQALGTTSGDWTLSNVEISRIQAASVTIGSTVATGFTVGGNITLAGVDAGSGTSGIASWTIDAVGPVNGDGSAQVRFEAGDSSFKALTVRAIDGIRVDSNITTTVGSLSFNPNTSVTNANDRLTIGAGKTLTSAGGLTLTGVTSGEGALGLNAADGVTLAGVTTTAGNVTIDADTNRDGTGTFSLSSGGLSTGGGDLTVTSADISLNAAINVGPGAVVLRTVSGRTMQVGGSLAAANWNLLASEVGRISAGGLVVGGDENGLLTVGALLATITTNIDSATLRSTGNGQAVRVDTAATFKALTIEADNGIKIDGDLSTTVGDLALNSDVDRMIDGAESITLSSGRALRAGRDLVIDAGNGAIVGSGSLNLFANRNVDLRSPLSSGALVIDADRDRTGDGVVRIASSAGIVVANAPATLRGADIELGSMISTGTGALNLETSVPSTRIGVGDSAQTFQIDQKELDRIINTTGLVTIGSATQTAGISVAASEAISLVNSSRDLNVRFLTAGSVNIGSSDVSAGALLTITADADRSGTGLVDQSGGRIRVDRLVVSAGSGIDLKTSVGEISAANSTSGDLRIEELDDSFGSRSNLILRDISQGGPGIVAVTADQSIFLQRVVTALGDTNAVFLTSTSGSIGNHSDAATGPRLVTRQAVLDASQGIGSDASPLVTSITELAARNAVAGDISIRNVGSATLTLGPGGSLPGVTNPGGNVRVVTTGNLATQSVSSKDLVALQSLGGAIVSARTAPGASIEGKSLALRSASGIGTSGTPLSTSVSQLAFENASGSVNLHNDKAPGLTLVAVDGIAQTTSGGLQNPLATVNIRSAQDLTVATPVFAPDAIFTLYAVGDLSFQKATGLAPSEVMTIQTADFLADADTVNPFSKSDGIQVVTSEGSVLTPYPDMTVTSVQSFNGAAQLTLELDAGMNPYQVSIEWSAVQFKDTTTLQIIVDPALPPGGPVRLDTPSGDNSHVVRVPPSAIGGGKTTVVINHSFQRESTSDSVDNVRITLICVPAPDLKFVQRSGGTEVTSTDANRNPFGNPIMETLGFPTYEFETTIVVFASAVNFVYEGVRTTPQVNIASPTQELVPTDQPVPPISQVQVPVSVSTVEEQSTTQTLRFLITPITDASAAADLGGSADTEEFVPGDLDTLEALRDYFRKRGQDGRFRVQVRFGDVEREQFEVRVQDGKIVDDDGDSEDSDEGRTPGDASLTPDRQRRLAEPEGNSAPEKVVRSLPETKSGIAILPGILGTAVAAASATATGNSSRTWAGEIHSALSGSHRSGDGWLARLRRRSHGSGSTPNGSR